MRKTALIVLAVFCGAALNAGRPAPADRAPGGASAWTAIGPCGGEVRALARNSKRPNEIYAAFGRNPARIFRSTDGAKSWAPAVILDDNVADMAADPKDASVVYAYVGYRILKSSNRGLSFPETIQGPTNFYGYSGRMAVHPGNPKIIIIAGYFVTSSSSYAYCPAVARTTDGGKTWAVIKFEPTSQRGGIYDVAFHPRNPNVVMVCGEFEKGNTTKVGIYRSSNGGASYKNVTQDAVFNSGSFNRVYALAFHPTDPNVALVGHNGNVARTTNGGVSWQNQSSPGYILLSAFATDKAKPNTVYGLGGSNTEGYRGLWTSTDGGNNWTNSPNGIYSYGERLLVNGSAMIAGTWAGIFRTQNAGALWTASHAGIKATHPGCFAVAPSSPQTIFSEVANYAMFKTVNGGGAWTMCPYFYRCESILSFIVHPADPKKVFYLAGG